MRNQDALPPVADFPPGAMVVVNGKLHVLEGTSWKKVGGGMSHTDWKITGGGGVYATSTAIKWSYRFILISQGRSLSFAQTGYFNIDMPPDGTVIPGVGGAPSVTVSGGVIPWAPWRALYYILPVGSNYVSKPENFRIAAYTADFEVPENWVLIALENRDISATYFANGIIRYNDGKTATQNDPYPQYAPKPHSVTSTADHTFPGGTTTFLRADATWASAAPHIESKQILNVQTADFTWTRAFAAAPVVTVGERATVSWGTTSHVVSRSTTACRCQSEDGGTLMAADHFVIAMAAA